MRKIPISLLKTRISNIMGNMLFVLIRMDDVLSFSFGVVLCLLLFFFLGDLLKMMSIFTNRWHESEIT